MNQIIDHHTMRSHTHAQHLLAALLLTACSALAQVGPGSIAPLKKAVYPPPLAAATFTGTVNSATDAEVRLTLTGIPKPNVFDQLPKVADSFVPFVPSAGDKVEIYFKIPDVEADVAVGSGTVVSADETTTTLKFEQGTGKPQAGYLARIHSAAPSWTKTGLSVANAFEIAIACRHYVSEYNRFPAALDALLEGKNEKLNPRRIGFIQDERVLHCPLLGDDSQIGYELAGAVEASDPPGKVLFRSKAVSTSGERVIGYNDGSVKLVRDGATAATPSPAPAPMPALAPVAPATPAAPAAPTPPPAPTTTSQQGASPFISWLGLTTDRVPIEMIEALHLRPRSGAQVIYATSGGPAALAGLQKDDIISEIDGEIARDGDVLRLSKTRQPGTKVAFTVSRNLQTYVKEVTFAPRPNDAVLTEKFRVEAEAGDAGAQRAYGISLINGTGVRVDVASGMNWLTRAAEQNLRSAQALLARIYDEKTGDADAQAKAIEWFRRAAALGDSYSQFRLALHYFERRDFAQAADHARMAAEQGETAAEDMYGSMLVNGEGVKSNPTEGVRWIKLAAATGLPSALYHLGNVQLTGSGTRRDIETGLKNLHAAAEGNLVEAMIKLGALYEEGRLVTRNAAVARQWRERAAAARNAVAAAPRLPAPTPPPPAAIASMPAASPVVLPRKPEAVSVSTTNPGAFAGTFKGEVTLVSGSTQGAPVAAGGPCPAKFTIRLDPSGTVWGLDIRSDRSKPNASQLDGHWNLKASGTTLSSSYDLPAGSESVSIEIIGNEIKGSIASQTKSDGAVTRSSSYSIRATRTQ